MSKLSWNDLFLSGSIVALSTSIWRARLQIKPKDFGIGESASVQQALSMGSTRLAPADAFDEINKIVADAKRAVDHYGLTFGFVFGTRYVPEANLEKLSNRLRELRTKFEAAVEEFVSKYDQTKETMLPVIEQALKDAAKNEEAAANAIARVRDEYPSATTVRSKFSLHWSVYAIQGPKQKGAEAALASEGETVKGVVSFMVTQLREDVTTKLADVLALIQKGGVIREGSLKTAMEVLDRVEQVNVLGDADLSDKVKRLRSVLSGIDVSARVSDQTVAGLEDIKVQLEEGMADAIQAAERSLTSVGRRRIAA